MRKVGGAVVAPITVIFWSIAGIGWLTAACFLQIGGKVASIIGVIFLIGQIKSCKQRVEKLQYKFDLIEMEILQ